MPSPNWVVPSTWNELLKIGNRNPTLGTETQLRGLKPSWWPGNLEHDPTCCWCSGSGCPGGSEGRTWTRYPVTLPVAATHESLRELWLCSLTRSSRGPRICSAAKTQRKGFGLDSTTWGSSWMESMFSTQRKMWVSFRLGAQGHLGSVSR